MTIETSTANVLLGVAMSSTLAMQGWIVVQLFKLKTKVSLIISHCQNCPKGSDTDQITR